MCPRWVIAVVLNAHSNEKAADVSLQNVRYSRNSQVCSYNRSAS